MKVYCKSCHTVLTPELQRLPYLSLASEEDGKPYIPQGYYLISDGEFFTNTRGKIIINPSNLINSWHHEDTAKLIGCCGLDGTEGPNRICIHKHGIASEFSDCWTPHALLFEVQAVYTIE